MHSATIYTIGHSTLPIEQFMERLTHYGIELLVDIRTIPRSRYNPQFNEQALANASRARGIAYLWCKDLGGLRKAHADSINTGWRNGGFRGYADYMQTDKFKQALQQLIQLAQTKRTAVMCAEAVPWRCHRSLVADALIVRGYTVMDILTESDLREHALTFFASVQGLDITYPGSQASLL